MVEVVQDQVQALQETQEVRAAAVVLVQAALVVLVAQEILQQPLPLLFKATLVVVVVQQLMVEAEEVVPTLAQEPAQMADLKPQEQAVMEPQIALQALP